MLDCYVFEYLYLCVGLKNDISITIRFMSNQHIN